MKKQDILNILENVYDKEMKRRDFDIKWYEDKKNESEYDFERERFNLHLNAALLCRVVVSDLINEIKQELINHNILA